MASKRDAAAEVLRQVPEGNVAVFRLVEELEGGGKCLIIEHRKALPEAHPAPLGVPSHRFDEIQGFIGYLERYGASGDMVIMVDPATGAATAVLAEMLDEPPVAEARTVRITYSPTLSPEAKRLPTKPMTPAQFVAFLRRNRASILWPDSSTVSALIAELRVCSRATVYAGKASGQLLQVEARGGNESAPVEIPEAITLAIRLHMEDVKPVEVSMPVELVATNDGALVEVNGDGIEAAREAHARFVYVTVCQTFGSAAVVAWGAYQRVEWPERKA